jgi:hypothetical protein
MQYLLGRGQRSIQIDHFDPRRKRDVVQDYDNLFLAVMGQWRGGMPSRAHYERPVGSGAVRRFPHATGPLLLASAHCNSAKSDNWPSAAQERCGVRFLNCCREQDYGAVLFEHRTTHLLVGTTPAAKYHIEMLDLNADHLVQERSERARLRDLLDHRPALLRLPHYDEHLVDVIDALRRCVEEMIPPIPAPPDQGQSYDAVAVRLSTMPSL